MIDKLALSICGLFIAYIYRALFPALTGDELAQWYYQSGYIIFVVSVVFLLFSILTFVIRRRCEERKFLRLNTFASIIYTIFLGFFVFYLP